MFQNVLMTALTPLSKRDEINSWENRPFTTIWPETTRQKTKETNVTKTIKKKSKRVRTAFTTEQIRILDKKFSQSRYIDAESRRALAAHLNIEDKCIKIWFQNRRMKEKRDSESSCDSSIENFSYATSTPLESQTCQTLEPTVKVEDFNYQTTLNTDNYTPEYQLPTSRYDCFVPPQYQNAVNIMPTNISLGYDTNVYPTQYYPCETGYYTNMGDQYAQYNTESDWSTFNFDFGFN